jgi:hypothetical protein
VSINDGYLGVVVKTSKNHPEGFWFRVRVDQERPNCVGVFMLDYMILMEIRVGDPGSFFACKLSCTGGILRAVPSERVSDSTMRASCKTLIAASGLDPSEYATYSSKRGGALMALQAGLSTAQIQELGRWSSSDMVSSYAKGGDDTLENLLEACPILLIKNVFVVGGLGVNWLRPPFGVQALLCSYTLEYFLFDRFGSFSLRRVGLRCFAAPPRFFCVYCITS